MIIYKKRRDRGKKEGKVMRERDDRKDAWSKGERDNKRKED